LRYTNAVGITGVCAVNRSCLATGMYSSSIGSQDMRSRTRLPPKIRVLSAYLRDAGYYCTNSVKTDYNFPVPGDAWDANSRQAHWKNRGEGQPFFAVFNYTGTHESQIWDRNYARHAKKLNPGEFHDPAHAPIPPFHPDTPRVRRDWANYHDNITVLDKWVAGHLQQLEEAGLAENTIVFFFSDHGAGMPLVKKLVWDGGLRVPLIVYLPDQYKRLAKENARGVTERLVSFVDFPPTVLSLAGVDIPEHMQGQAFLGAAEKPPRKTAYAIRDRMGEFYDIIRVVRDKRYQYHRNFLPHLPVTFISYTMRMPTTGILLEMSESGKLNKIQARYFQPKPTEELYDLAADPHCVRNLADDPAHAARLQNMREKLRSWQLRTRDLGLMTEYEMHRRSAGSTPFETAQDASQWPLERVLPVAELASQRDAANLPRLRKLLSDDEPIIRWWAAMGLVILGEQARDADRDLQASLKDKSPLVRVAAGEALYRLGEKDASHAAMEEALQHPTPFVRLRALNALVRMGDDARPAIPAIKAAGITGHFPSEYVNRMVEYLPKRLGD